MPPRTPRLAHPHHRVTAVVVACDGARYLPETLAALAAQTRPPQWTVAADAGSADGSRDLLTEAYGESRVVELPRGTGFGAAVAAAVARADELLAADPPKPLPRRRAADAEAPKDPVDWLWLVHDDCAPYPGALAALLEAANDSPSAAVLGPKARDWDDPRLLVEVGLTMDRAGRRETGLERREFDQGQHDDRRDVLAVGTAGCLVRRDVWDALGGLDPRLPLYRDDIDLGWRVNAAGHRVLVVPAALVRHARAAWSGDRQPPAAPGRPTGIDRRHSLAVLLANLPRLALLAALPRLLAGAALRTIAFLLTRQVAAARDEVGAVAWNVAHAGDLLAARRRRRPHRTVPFRALSPLFTGRAARLRGYAEAFGAWVTGGTAEGLTELDEDPDAPPPPRRSRLAVFRSRPGFALFVALLVVSLLAVRGLLGGGSLVGGRLLPGPPGSDDYWREYAASWHRAGAGSGEAAPPSLALLGALSWLLLGKGWLVVDVLLFGTVPLAGLTAWRATRGFVWSPVARLWAAATYALLPVATGAVAEGRVDTAVAHLAMPLLVAAGARLLLADPKYAGWRTPFATGVGLSLVVAFAPQVWLLAAVPLVVGSIVVLLGATPASRAGAVRRILAVQLALLTPLAVLFPWSLRLLSSPAALFSGPATVIGPEPRRHVQAADLLLLRPGGPAMPWRWLFAGVVLAALAGLLRRERSRAALAAWVLAIGALAAAYVTATGARDLEPAYPGAALALAACAMLAAALVGAERARERLARQNFGWRQLLATAVAGMAAVAPLVAAGSWVARGADDPVERRAVGVLPAAALAEGRNNPGTRVLWLDRPGDEVRYALTPSSGLRLTDAHGGLDAEARRVLDGLVGDITSPRGTFAADALATFAVRFIAVPEPVDPRLAAALDSQSGLSRVGYVGSVQLWKTLSPSSRLTLLQPELANAAREGRFNRREDVRAIPPIPLRSRAESAQASISPGSPGRLLVLSERADEGWVATLNGRPLPPVTAYGWAQAFELPTEGGELAVRRDNGPRRRDLTIQGVLVLLALVLAAPNIRRGDDADDEEIDEPAEELAA